VKPIVVECPGDGVGRGDVEGGTTEVACPLLEGTRAPALRRQATSQSKIDDLEESPFFLVRALLELDEEVVVESEARPDVARMASLDRCRNLAFLMPGIR